MAGQVGQCTLAGVPLRVLSWNLFHGRAQPPARRDLLDDFARALASWRWEVALLQEVPPWWPAVLADRLEAAERRVLTSRNSLPALRRAVAVRRPDLIRANGGGSNAILVRGASIDEHRARRLSLLPERRWIHAVRLGSLWVANVHIDASVAQARAAAAVALAWAAGDRVVLGGDFNLEAPALEGFAWAGGVGVDHVYRGDTPLAAPEFEILDRGQLSDHAPVLTRIA